MDENDLPDTLVIAGPTASGKSALALEMAARLDCEIVGCDAMQLYRGPTILTAQVPETERKGIPHFLTGSVDPIEEMDASRYATLAADCIREIHARGKRALIVGGTGLYLRSLIFGLEDGLPSRNEAWRAEAAGLSPEELRSRLLALDPEAGNLVDLQNPVRVIRAIEIVSGTGKPLALSRKGLRCGAARLPVAGWRLSPERSHLQECIKARAAAMWEAGVIEEVASLPPMGSTASAIIGLREAREVIAGNLDRAGWIAAVTIATRQYAKRQETWFRREDWLERL